ncbi:hypothetical protein GGS21DRAFT_197099 [Xylaria nigripes]|nr:hypothetical protein GGS21DRAFT_197099 [Xylaria nigripes]
MPGAGTRDSPYAPRSPDLSSIYGPDGLSYHSCLPTPGTSTPAGYYSLQSPAQIQVPVQAAQAQAPVEARTLAQPHHYQNHHFNTNSRLSVNPSAIATIPNHNPNHKFIHNHHLNITNTNTNNHNHNHNHSQYPYHLSAQQQQQLYQLAQPPPPSPPPPPQQAQAQAQQQQQQQQQPPFTAHNHNNTLGPYFLSGLRYHPSIQPQYQQPPPQQIYHLQAASSYHPSHSDSLPPTNRPSTNQIARPQQHVPQRQPQQRSPLSFNKATAPSIHSNTMPRGKAAAQVAKEPEIMESPVRTKFPTARIKRIMQADEEVGKVAQQTPIAVGKALELFMVQLVQKSADVAKDKGSKRITAPMLKQAIDSTNEWDFLRDIVAKVTEEKEGAKSSGRPKADSESDDDGDVVEVKKRGRGGRRKKTAA